MNLNKPLPALPLGDPEGGQLINIKPSRPPRPVDVIYDSNMRLAGSSNNAPSFPIRGLDDAVGACVLWTMIPYSYFVIDRTCNTFYATTTTIAGTTDPPQAIAITPGTHSALSLAGDLTRAFAQTTLEGQLSFVAFMGEGEARLILYHASLEETDESFAITIDNERLANILGFDAGVEYTSSYESIWRNGAPLSLVVEAGTKTSFHTIRAPRVMNLMGSPSLRLHSSLASKLYGSCVYPNDPGDVLADIPVTGNFTNYMFYQTGGAMIPISQRGGLSGNVNFSLSLGDRTLYADNSYAPFNDDFALVDYLPLNGLPFSVCIRYFVDDGVLF